MQLLLTAQVGAVLAVIGLLIVLGGAFIDEGKPSGIRDPAEVTFSSERCVVLRTVDTSSEDEKVTARVLHRPSLNIEKSRFHRRTSEYLFLANCR